MISLGAFVAVGLLAVGMTTPAEAFREPSLSEFESSSTPLVALTPAIAQKVKVDAAVATAASDDKAGRDSYTGMSYAENQRAVYQALGQGFAPGFIPTTGAIRWPFLKSVPMSSGYGEVRGDGIHNGTDFNPGVGAEIGAIADGVVTWVGWKPGWGYGYFVTIEHNVDGVKVESLYGHMIDQSSQLYPGQSVTVGQIVGLTGDTGYSFGPHLHLEIRIAGERTDPYTWLTEHATNG